MISNWIIQIKRFFAKFLFVFLVPLLRKFPSPVKQNTGICMLLGHEYTTMGIYALTSFFFQIKSSLPVYILDDGTLTVSDKEKLRSHFTVQIESMRESEKKIRSLIKFYPFFQKYRFQVNTSVFRRQIDVCLLSPFDKFIYLDSDILFFNEPIEIQKWLKSNTKKYLYTIHSPGLFNGKNVPEYSFRKLLYKYLNLQMDPSFNAGILCFSDKKILDLQKIEKVMQLFDEVSFNQLPPVSECLFSVLFAQSKFSEVLPYQKYANTPFIDEYKRRLEQQRKGALISLHLSFLSKSLFPAMAVKLTIREKFFRS